MERPEAKIVITAKEKALKALSPDGGKVKTQDDLTPDEHKLLRRLIKDKLTENKEKFGSDMSKWPLNK